ncbi:MAG: hypothetical protein A2Z20_09680 [Bdellovibrionales bacterium RBG_16_40_8]|nr:MAG: hypothetical protein A2Z20_09680 [Bdellovibrionales bacterium RBG_16_40_8]
MLLIFIAEALVMFILPYLVTTIYSAWVYFLDSFLLSIIIAPILWKLVVKPLEDEKNKSEKSFLDAQKANKTKDEFLATLSHELRTPLNVVHGWIEILKTEKLSNSEYMGVLEILDRNSKLQTELINDLLDVSRIVAGKMVMDFSPISILDVINSAKDSMTFPVKEKMQTLHIDPENNATALQKSACHLLGNFSGLQRVFVNLLSNAIKFTPERGLISVHLGVSEKEIAISVRDNGQGIDQLFIPKIFDPFAQENSSSVRTQTGLGLGLAIVRHIVEYHGGHITVKSQGHGKGSEFTVSLPCAQQNIADKIKSELKSTAAAGFNLTGVKILLVDDSIDVRTLYKFVLSRTGAEVTMAGSASEALNLFQEKIPDIILSDIAMPGEDGYSLIKKIRSLPENKGGRIPAIALTAYAREIDTNKTIVVGFNTHLSKPVSNENLIKAICEVLKRPC